MCNFWRTERVWDTHLDYGSLVRLRRATLHQCGHTIGGTSSPWVECSCDKPGCITFVAAWCALAFSLLCSDLCHVDDDFLRIKHHVWDRIAPSSLLYCGIYSHSLIKPPPRYFSREFTVSGRGEAGHPGCCKNPRSSHYTW